MKHAVATHEWGERDLTPCAVRDFRMNRERMKTGVVTETDLCCRCAAKKAPRPPAGPPPGAPLPCTVLVVMWCSCEVLTAIP